MRYFTLLILCCFTLSISAQLRKGDHLLTLGSNGQFAPEGAIAVPLLSGNLGGILFPSDFSGGAFLYATPTYGFVLTDRIVVGGALSWFQNIGDGGDRYFGLSPYARYYAVNRETLGVFGQVATGLSFGSDNNFSAFKAVGLGAGVQIPLGPGIRFGPTVNYSIVRNRPNIVDLGASFEIVLGRNNRLEEEIVAGFAKGSLMLGSQYVAATFRENTSSAGVVVGGHYFLTDRLTAALSVGVEGDRFEFSNAAITLKNISTRYSIGAGSRYYFTTGQRLVWYGEAGGGYQLNRLRSEDSNGSSSSNYDGFMVTGSLGGQLFIRDNLALEAGPQFRRYLSQQGGLSIVSLNVGVRVIL